MKHIISINKKNHPSSQDAIEAAISKLDAAFEVLQTEASKRGSRVHGPSLALKSLYVPSFMINIYRAKRDRHRWIRNGIQRNLLTFGPAIPIQWYEPFGGKCLDYLFDIEMEGERYTCFMFPTRKWRKQVNELCRALEKLSIDEICYVYFRVHPECDVKYSCDDFMTVWTLPGSPERGNYYFRELEKHANEAYEAKCIKTTDEECSHANEACQEKRIETTDEECLHAIEAGSWTSKLIQMILFNYYLHVGSSQGSG